MGDVTTRPPREPAAADARALPVPDGDRAADCPVAVPPLPPARHAGVVLPGPAPAARRDRCAVRVPRGVGRHRQRVAARCSWDLPIQEWVEANRTQTPRHVLPHHVALRVDDGRARRSGALLAAALVGQVPRGEHRDRRRHPRTPAASSSCSKIVVGRDRPDLERMVNGHGPSFPSGHVMASVALWGLLPLVVALFTRSRDPLVAVGRGVGLPDRVDRRRAGSTSACTGRRTCSAACSSDRSSCSAIEAVLGYAHRISGCGGVPRHESDARARAS